MGLKERWANFSYWKKGGLIGLILSIIISLPLILCYLPGDIVYLFGSYGHNPIVSICTQGVLNINYPFAYLTQSQIIYLLPYLPKLILGLYAFIFSSISYMYIKIIFANIILLSIIGLLVGLIVGLIKDKKFKYLIAIFVTILVIAGILYFTLGVSRCEPSENKADCYSLIYKIKGQSICSGQPDLDYCYSDVAYKLGNILICESISDSLQKDVCFKLIAHSKKDPTICEKISSAEQKDSCYGFIALSLREDNLCRSIVSLEKKDDCYSQLAYSKKDPTLCGEISGQKTKDSCYMIQATQVMKDSFFCSKISETSRDSCYSNFSEQ